MPGLLIKDLPPELHARLKQEAARHHRSMTRQALMLLEQALRREGNTKAAAIPPEPIDSGPTHDREWVYRVMRGKATKKLTTDEIMALTRGE